MVRGQEGRTCWNIAHLASSLFLYLRESMLRSLLSSSAFAQTWRRKLSEQSAARNTEERSKSAGSTVARGEAGEPYGPRDTAARHAVAQRTQHAPPTKESRNSPMLTIHDRRTGLPAHGGGRGRRHRAPLLIGLCLFATSRPELPSLHVSTQLCFPFLAPCMVMVPHKGLVPRWAVEGAKQRGRAGLRCRHAGGGLTRGTGAM